MKAKKKKSAEVVPPEFFLYLHLSLAVNGVVMQGDGSQFEFDPNLPR